MSAQYDFQNISYDDFERLCADLLSIREAVVLESFKDGRDQGIDLRWTSSTGGTVIGQCKRYAPHAFARLLRDLRSKELPKISLLAPERYILCTSCKLSPQQKDQLFGLLRPYCIATSDILGADELNQLIAANDAVERRHFKLWLGSAAILQRVLHAGVFNYSANEVDSLRREISRYVVHEGFYRALHLLDESHHCIIVGIPGVGKTTAARLLISHYIREGFDVVSVTKDIEDAWKVLDRPSDAKVVIYYDDFLGQMSFSQKLGKNEDRRLLELIAYCKNTKGKRFILTTRDYIFDQALSAYEPLGRAKHLLERSSVRLDDYGLLVRARLLANHLQFSEVGAEVLREVVERRIYDQIIRHPNFLPRMVEQLCSDKAVKDKSPDAFIKTALAVLDDPAQVWKRPFGHLSQEARFLAYSLVSLNGTSEAGRLEDSWRSLCRELSVLIERDFIEVLREIEGSFTHSQMFPGLGKNPCATFVGFINPSAREFVLTDLIGKPALFRAVIDSAVAFSQLLFWTEARITYVLKTPLEAARSVADDIRNKAIALLPICEPTVSYWVGERRVIWNPCPKKIQRLKSMFGALDDLGRPDLKHSIALDVLNGELVRYRSLLAPDDLMWAPEVFRVMISAIESSGSEDLGVACETLNVDEWGELANDLPEVGYIWDAATEVISLAHDPQAWSARVRGALQLRIQELLEAIPRDWLADEISQSAEELELVSQKLDLDFDDQVIHLRALAQEKEESRIQDYEAASLTSRYSARRTAEADGLIEGLFRNLLDQAGSDEH